MVGGVLGWLALVGFFFFLEAMISIAISVKMLGNSSGQQSQNRRNVTQLLK